VKTWLPVYNGRMSDTTDTDILDTDEVTIEGDPEPPAAPAQSSPIIERLKSRVDELVIAKARGFRLTSAQNNLLDFWFVDCQRGTPSDELALKLLESASAS
jgi:hypothetical protein